MSLRGRLFLAQTPLALALVVVGIASGVAITTLGESSRLILADNYRSVLAAERMKEAIERLDSAALFALAGHDAAATEVLAPQTRAFEESLAAETGNITEPGEETATKKLHAAWARYHAALGPYFAGATHDERDRVYFQVLAPDFSEIKRRADEILAINQDAMVQKSGRVERSGHRFEQLMLATVLLALALGIFASTWLIARILNPLRIVSAAVRRFGQGDPKARANLTGSDELGALAREFNAMAEHLERYRASSLGELIAAQAAAQAAIDGLPDPVLLLDATGAIQGVNAAATARLGVDAEKSGSAAFTNVDPGVRAVVDRLRTHVLGGRGAYVPRGFEEAVRVATASDGERIFLPRATPIYGDAGAVSGVALVLQDATRLFRFDELKNDLVATVAHEFRTPLTSLRMALHLCTEHIVGPLTDKQADVLYAAREDCERLQVIVDDLLNLSRLEAGHIDLQRRRVDPATLVASAVEVHRAAAGQAELKLTSEVPPGLEEVFVDPERLELVFTNLISNAVRYSPKHGTIAVRARAERDAVRFEVEDGGPGISAEHQAGLFEKFYRVPGSPEGGSGLGLFIARGLVQAHGGEIGVTSAPGTGATFWFRIPTAPKGPARP